MTCARIDLEVDDLDLENDVRGVVDGHVRRAEFLELVSFGDVVEEEERVFAEVVEVGFPDVVGAGDS